MSERDLFESVTASLYEAMLEDARWPATSKLIDEACGVQGNVLMVGEGPEDDVRMSFIGLYHRGQRRLELERQYEEVYHPVDEGVPRFRQLPFGRLVALRDLYTEEEKRTSPAYNESHPRARVLDGWNVRLEGPEGYSHIGWSVCDPVKTVGGESDRVAMIKRLGPHIRQYVKVRQVVAKAGMLGASLTDLLSTLQLGVVHLDRRGRILAANDRACDILRYGDELSDQGGFLQAGSPRDRVSFERLLASALPSDGSVGVSCSMVLRCSFSPRWLIIHVKPTIVGDTSFGRRWVAALVLIAEPGQQSHIDPQFVASTLGLTRAESEVAVWLAEGRTVRDVAVATGRKDSSIYWHLRQIYEKLEISRQADLVRLVLSIAKFS